MHNWTIDYEDGFIKQISQLAIETQDKIQKKISNVAIFDDPRQAGSYMDCGSDDDCPYIVQIYPGLAFEFTYEMDTHNGVLKYLDCFELDILNHGQKPNV